MIRLQSPLFLLAAFFLVVALATTKTAAAAEVEMEMEMDEASMSTTSNSNSKKSGSSSKKKAGLFQRLSRVLDTGAAEDDDGSPIDWEASKDEGEEVDPSMIINPLTAKDVVDAWAKDENLSLLQRAMDGDMMSGMKKILSRSEDLQDIWAAPQVFRFLMKEMPLFKAIKPVAAVVEGKNEEDYTSEDGKAAATAFRKFMLKTADVLENLRSPEGFMKKIQDYANSRDEEMLRLFEAANNGEDENHMKLNNFLMKKELGDCK